MQRASQRRNVSEALAALDEIARLAHYGCGSVAARARSLLRRSALTSHLPDVRQNASVLLEEAEGGTLWR